MSESKAIANRKTIIQNQKTIIADQAAPRANPIATPPPRDLAEESDSHSQEPGCFQYGHRESKGDSRPTESAIRPPELAHHLREEAGVEDGGEPVLEKTMGWAEIMPLPSFTVMH